MKRIILVAWFVMVLLVGFLGGILMDEACAGNGGTGLLKVVVTGCENDNGEMKVTVFDSAESFPKKGKPVRVATAPVRGGQAEVAFADLPFGVYALTVFHDENGNGKLDMNSFGKPTERYGFSNNARALFAPPSFEKARFAFDKTEMVVTITVK